jgi:alginate O-acetyltransferase complex protein AlgI
MLTMLLGGLWHGAAWTFVAWGAFHGLWLGIERVARAYLPTWRWLQSTAMQALYGLFTLLVVIWAWVWFRAPDFATASKVHLALLGNDVPGAAPISTDAKVAIVAFVVLCLAHWATRSLDLRDTLARAPAWSMGLLWGALLSAMALSPGAGRAFIYFQF